MAKVKEEPDQPARIIKRILKKKPAGGSSGKA
jgi:hypothetical protein